MSMPTTLSEVLDAFQRSQGRAMPGLGQDSGRTTVEAWLLRDPRHFDVLLEQHWPHAARGPSFARMFYWEQLQNHRPELLEQAIGFVRVDPWEGMDTPDWERVVRELVSMTDVGSYPHLVDALDDLITTRLTGIAVSKSRYQLARQVVRVALGDYLVDDDHTFEDDVRGLKRLLALGYAQHTLATGSPEAWCNIVHVLVDAGGQGFASRQWLVRERFAWVLSTLLKAGANLSEGAMKDYPQLDRPLETVVFRWIRATDEEWQQTNASMAHILMEAGAPWERVLEIAGPDTKVGREIAGHPVVRRERMVRQLPPGALEQDGSAAAYREL